MKIPARIDSFISCYSINNPDKAIARWTSMPPLVSDWNARALPDRSLAFISSNPRVTSVSSFCDNYASTLTASVRPLALSYRVTTQRTCELKKPVSFTSSLTADFSTASTPTFPTSEAVR